MFKIEGSKITLTRGDDAVIELSVFTPDNKPYQPQEGEKARFTVRKRPLYNNSTPPLIEKDFAFATYGSKDGESESNESKTSFGEIESRTSFEIRINSIDTKFMDCGQYLYDVQFCDLKNNLSTICNGKFELTYEVG